MVSSLPYPASERTWLLRHLNRVSDDHKVRGVLFQGNEENVREAFGDDAALQVRDFMSDVGSVSAFAWVSARDYFLLNACLAAFWDQECYSTGVRQEARAWFSAFADNPLAKVVRAGMLETMSDIMAFQCQTVSRFYNFGDPWVEELGKQHIRLYYDRCHAPLLSPMAAGVVDGLFEIAGLGHELTIEVDEELGSSMFELRW